MEGLFDDWEATLMPIYPVETVALAGLRPNPKNSRSHSKKQIRQLGDSIAHFGFVNPIITDERLNIVAGHGRYEAAKLLGLTEVPAIRLTHLSAAQIRAYMLADNKLAEKAGWDRKLLAAELEELTILLPEIGLDISATGFEPSEIDTLLIDLGSDYPDPADELPEPNQPKVSRPGDLFVLGRHRLLVGDSRNADCFLRLLGNERAAMAFLDPPYNVRIDGHVGGRGRTKHREFVCASGEMSRAQFTEFLTQTLGLCASHSRDGAISFVCMDWRHQRELLDAGEKAYDELKNVCVWAKTTPAQGSFYRSQHELIYVFKHGTAPHINNFELGQYGRTRSNIWSYAGINTFRAGRMDELRLHPTTKPVALVADAMRDCSQRDGIILDAFCGSGTTIIAAEKVGRRAFCIEIDPGYGDVAIRRWQDFTKKDALLECTCQTFEELFLSRAGDTGGDGPAS